MNALAALNTHPMVTLIRREFWEHRSLWIAPLVVAGLLLLALLTGLFLGRDHLYIDVDGMPGHDSRTTLSIVLLSLSAPQLLTMAVLLWFYLLDCLYTERKDRSILFWKSMPVSDASTVLSKLLVALLVMPLGVYVLTILFDLLAIGVVASGVSGSAAFWDLGAWLKLRAAMLPDLMVMMLWYAPIAGYLLLVSAWGRRSVVLWASLPPVLLMVIEDRTFDTHYVATFLQYRLAGVWKFFGAGDSVTAANSAPGSLFDVAGSVHALLDPDMWLGVLAAALFIFAAVRIRRYRDDTD